MRIVFMGTPAFAVPALVRLVDEGHDIAAVYTQPPRPANRGRLTRSAVHEAAEARGLHVRTPSWLRGDDEAQAFRALDAELCVVAAYGLILPRSFLDAPARGCLNLHASLLPRWRGAAPVQHAILAGDRETGITLMAMDEGLDTGPMLAARALEVGEATAGELTARLAELGAEMLADALAGGLALASRPQPADGVTYAPRITPADARLDWTRPAEELARRVRAMAPRPGAWFLDPVGRRVKLETATASSGEAPPGMLHDGTAVGTGSGLLVLGSVVPEGRRPMKAEAWVHGLRADRGARLG